MARTNDGSLWFATGNALVLCNQQIDCSPTIPNIDPRYLTTTPSETVNEIWSGTRGNGLMRNLLDPTIRPFISQLDSEQGLPSQNVFAVLPEHQADGSEVLLIGTTRGVARYRPGHLEPTLFASRIISK